MKIGIITDQIDKNPNSGPSVYLSELIMNLLRCDEIHLYLIHNNSSNNPIYEHAHEIVLPNKISRSMEVIKKLNLDILHLNYIPKLREFYLFKICKNIVVTIHGDLIWHSPKYVPASKLNIYCRRFIDYITSKCATRLIAVSNSLKGRLIDYLAIPPEKIDVVYNGVNHEIFKPMRVTQQHFDERKWDIENMNYILHVSNYAPKKNAETLLDAFKLLIQDHPNIKLVIAGGRWDKFFEKFKYKFNNIIYVGKVSTYELALLYNGAICFVSPSLHETFGLTFVEAMACGCPVIGSNLTSMPEIIGDAGILVENPLNAVELYYAMLSIVEDSSFRKKIARRGIYRSSKFDWEKTARGVVNVYKKIVE